MDLQMTFKTTGRSKSVRLFRVDMVGNLKSKNLFFFKFYAKYLIQGKAISKYIRRSLEAVNTPATANLAL